MNPDYPDARRAALAGVVCYSIWGLLPLAFQAMTRVGPSPYEILGWRIVWGAPAALAMVLAAGQGRKMLRLFRTPKALAWLSLSASLIGVNWLFYISAVTQGATLEASLGYYLTPLLNMAAGAVLFRERMDRLGKAAIALAALGVALQALALGRPPFVAVVLAVTFAGYGVVKKQVAVEAQAGLLVECVILAPFAVAILAFIGRSGGLHFGASPAATLWLVAAGPITATPLALFAWAARRLPLSSLGFLQFIAPTMGFFIGLAQHEPMGVLRLVSFGFIWAGGALFLAGAMRAAWRGRRVAA